METYNSIELTKQLVKDGKISQEIAETIFPELKESEDERIRKAILELVKQSSHILNPMNQKSMIAWLEKQGEQKVPVLDFKAKDWYVSKVDGKIHNIYHSVDKVEPKFKVGDWVVYNDDICQIVKREEGCNKLVTNFGIEKELVNERNLSTARLWTIQDAKDGDVLVEHETIVLFKKIEGLNIRCYCTYHYLGYNPTFYIDTLQNKTPYRPATKEQRDHLFQKMKEAGYEWNAEKKELKKIEQNPAWSEEDKEALRVVTNIFEQYGVKLLCYPAFVHWLKTLPNRITFNPYWKPSDEQMGALDDVISSRDIKYDILSELWKDLKKLKG